MGFTDEADDDGTLFKSFEGIFDLKYPALGRTNEFA